jgi:hypothetical protein
MCFSYLTLHLFFALACNLGFFAAFTQTPQVHALAFALDLDLALAFGFAVTI